ncbi:Heterokaryon incompatibility protein (HET) domain containing protein, partial [Hyaloscypha variabilis]
QPTRLLWIRTDHGKTTVQLIRTESLHAKFAALSYVWGGDQPNKLIHANIDSWTSGRSLNNLAPTIKDAVVVTAELGLEHLWIDSLCIIQDDIEDKMKEISQMAGIYEGAEVTIVAGEAGGVNVGFLNDRVVTADPSSCFKLPYFSYLKEEIGSVVLFKDVLHDKSYVHPPGTGTWAINRRAWTLQERLLSRRILEYGPLKHGWLCREVPTPDMNFIGGWTATPQRWEDMPPVLLHKSLATLSKVDSPTRLLEEWHDLIEEYTKRKLTEPKDRILAIAGLAEWYSKGIQTQYLAGLWRSWFPYELLWHAPNGSTARPKEYQGPSWSWTSIN